ncbi:MAG: hypothetical protein A2Y38_04595 [Spirochaetes bacterium GWB1_59_5]|nr:MAG: hypothetical protein A2Y38_04595 [Spirochaetes bacterium GWB1_59_5]
MSTETEVEACVWVMRAILEGRINWGGGTVDDWNNAARLAMRWNKTSPRTRARAVAAATVRFVQKERL